MSRFGKGAWLGAIHKDKARASEWWDIAADVASGQPGAIDRAVAAFREEQDEAAEQGRAL